jgi:hypothetical protein
MLRRFFAASLKFVLSKAPMLSALSDDKEVKARREVAVVEGEDMVREEVKLLYASSGLLPNIRGARNGKEDNRRSGAAILVSIRRGSNNPSKRATTTDANTPKKNHLDCGPIIRPTKA